jgi:DNA-binding NtrC family response regulator
VVLLENDENILGRHLHFLVVPSQATEPQPEGASNGFGMELPPGGISLEEVEKEIILRAYGKCGRNKSRTARFLKMPRHVLIYRLKKLGLEE